MKQKHEPNISTQSSKSADGERSKGKKCGAVRLRMAGAEILELMFEAGFNRPGFKTNGGIRKGESLYE